MKNKGFTLIELLAVIVIMAVIMLIATPLIVNVINDAKKGVFKNSAYGIVKAGETEYMSNQLKGTVEDLLFEYEHGKIKDGKDLNYKGKTPVGGKVAIRKDGKIAIAIHDGKWCAEKDYESNEVILNGKSLEDCVQAISLWSCGQNIIDSRDGKIYKTTKIGEQCWFAENLKYTGNGCLSKTWNSDDAGSVDACKANGDEIHYQWGAAMNGSTTPGAQGLCPSGWHIPTDAEWKTLEGTVDSTYGVGNAVWNNTGWRGTDVGKKLKGTSARGTDDYGFNALLAGSRNTDGSLDFVGSYGYWWSSSPSGTGAWRRSVNSSYDTVSRVEYTQALGFSVRCVRD